MHLVLWVAQFGCQRVSRSLTANIPAQSGVVKAIESNGLFDFFRNTILRKDSLPIPQSAYSGIRKSAAPVDDPGTMHPHLQANSAISCTVRSQEHNSCSFLDNVRYLIGSSSGFQDKAFRWRDHQRGRHARHG